MAARLASAVTPSSCASVSAAPATADLMHQPYGEPTVAEPQLLLSDRPPVPDVDELRTLAAAELQRYEAEASEQADRVYELTLGFAASVQASTSGAAARHGQGATQEQAAVAAQPSRWAARLGQVLGGLQAK
jgi:hypothetical protein